MNGLRQFPGFMRYVSAAKGRLEGLRNQLKLPEKYKGGRLEKLSHYWKSLLEDYGAAVNDIVADSRSRPRKAAVILSGLGMLGVMVKTNPDETSFRDAVAESSNRLLLLSDAIRNPASESHVRHLEYCLNKRSLRTVNLLFFTLVWENDFGSGCDAFAAHCSYLRPAWLDFHKRVLDIGILDTWCWLTYKMRDHDVNTDEWAALEQR